MDTVYQERANGRFEYWTYSDGERIYLNPHWVRLSLMLDKIILRDVSTNIQITRWQ